MAKRGKLTKSEPITTYKGFNKELQCRGFQFEVGKTYTVSGEIKACENGFHACESPLDVWAYYPIVADDLSLTRYAEVVQSGALDRHSEDSKIASAEITIKAEITLPEFIRRGVEWIVSATKGKGDNPSGGYARIGSSGDYARIGSSGGYAQIGSSGGSAQIGSSGHSAQIGSSGGYAQIGSSGDYARIGSSGGYAQIGSSGHSAQIGSSGDYAQIGSSGDYAQIGSSGGYARIDASGNKGVIASAGVNTSIRAKDGAWISLAEFNDKGECVGFATGCIGKDGLKADTWYRAKDGKLVEAA